MKLLINLLVAILYVRLTNLRMFSLTLQQLCTPILHTDIQYSKFVKYTSIAFIIYLWHIFSKKPIPDNLDTLLYSFILHLSL